MCKDKSLAALDKELAELYTEAMEKHDGDKQEQIKKEQREWVKSTRNLKFVIDPKREQIIKDQRKWVELTKKTRWELYSLYVHRIKALKDTLAD